MVQLKKIRPRTVQTAQVQDLAGVRGKTAQHGKAQQMTRKDFQLIADVLRNADEIIDADAMEALASMFTARLTETNPAFDRARFLTACGVK